jgi:signal transduction histidine kinase
MAPRPWDSLRWRLPILFSVLIAVILAVFLWTTNNALERVLTRAGEDRVQVVSDQVASLMTQGVTRGTVEATRVAADPAIASALRSPSSDNLAAAKRVLSELAVANQPPAELWTRDGVLVLDAGPPAGRGAAGAVAPGRASRVPTTAGLSLFHVNGTAVAYELTTAVPADLGFVVAPRTFAAAQNSQTIQRLVGAGASVAIGNQRGDVWSDFATRVAGPPVDASRRGPTAIRTPRGDARIGAIGLIPNSPWAVWVDLPRTLVLAPARTLLRRMLWLAFAFTAVAALIVAVVSARITTPLHTLTSASEQIAGGRYTERVPADRRDEIGRLGAAFNIMAERVAAAHADLERRVDERTGELQEAMHELEAFSYSVSHDLRAPLRHVAGFANLLGKSDGASLSDEGRRHVRTIIDAAARMGQLIDDLLAFSRISRAPLTKRHVELNQLVQEARRELGDSPHAVAWQIHDLPAVDADPSLLRLVLVNLLSNAVKYSSKQPAPIVEVGASNGGTETVIFVRDNGEGFDMQYVHKLFGVFQRLHSKEEFEGTGIGLANVRRIVQRHGGRTWAEGELKRGATFYVALPIGEAAHAG